MADGSTDDIRLLPLREELTLHRGPHTHGGAPTWTLHDPASNRFFRIGWPEFEMLSRWDLRDPERVAQSINSETPLTTTAEAVKAFQVFLSRGNLLRLEGKTALDSFTSQVRAMKKNWASWLLKNYLFFRIPLVRPDRFLRRTLPWVAWTFSRRFLACVAIAATLGLVLAARQWDVFITTFMHFLSWQGFLYFAFALALAKVLHELGHAYMATRFGCRVATMGVAFLVLWPVLYTDTSDAWKLASRRQRLAIGAAGIMTELAVAAFALLAWNFLPDGPLRSSAFLLATTTWILTLAVNLNPFMRFDGYFLLSDALEVQNLQERAFALARWWLREMLFGFGASPPEPQPKGRRRFLVGFAIATWLYRFFLFLGIALLVYHLFFKALGVFLFVVEIVWFIGLPIARELRQWGRRRGQLRLNRQTVTSGALLAGFLGLLLAPWQATVHAPALIRAGTHTEIFVPSPARLRKMAVGNGSRVTEGSPLALFTSPGLEHRLAQVHRRIGVLRWELAIQGMEKEIRARNAVIQGELATAESEARALNDEVSRLSVNAPLSGVVVDLNEDLRPNDWLPGNAGLMRIIDPRTAIIEAWITEQDVARVTVGGDAIFYSEIPEAPSIPSRVVKLDRINMSTLPTPYLASAFDGPIPVRQDADGRLIPEQAIYRASLKPVAEIPSIERVIRGKVVIPAKRESLLARIWRSAVGVLVRESGF